MGFIDEKRTVSEFPVKPRRMKGYPAGVHRTKVCAAILGVVTLIGLGYSRLGSSQNIIKSWQDHFPSRNRREEAETNLFASFPVVGPMPKESVEAILQEKGFFFENTSSSSEREN